MLILFTIFTLGASTQGCHMDFDSNHCSIEQSASLMDCHSEDGKQSDSEHSGDCGCGCHLHSSTPIIGTESTAMINNFDITRSNIISLNYLLKVSDYISEINRPPISIS